MSLFNRTSTDEMPRRGKWKRRFLALLVLSLSSLLLSPLLLSHTPLLNWLLAHALPQLQGELRIGGASLWWFSRPVFTDIELRDANGQRVLHVPCVEGSKALVPLLCRPRDLGEFRLTQPALHVVCARDSSNLETILAYWLQNSRTTSDKSEFALDGLAVSVVFDQAHLVLEDADSGRKWSLDPLDLSVAIPRNRRTPLHLELNAKVADAPRHGQLHAKVSAQFVEGKGATRVQAEGVCEADALPLEAVEPLLRRLEPQLKLGGWLNARLQLQPSNGPLGTPGMRLAGSVSLQELALGDSLLGPDTLRLSRVETPCRLALEGSRLAIEELEMRSEVGKISLAGALDLAKTPREALLQPGQRVEAELNLARLADLMPNTLHLTKETRVQSGTVSLKLHSSLRGESLLLEGDLHTSDLEGQYQGQRIIWKEPFAIVLTAHQEPSESLPVFERFRCDSDFLRLEMSGSVEEWTTRGSFNLGRLSEHLAGFVDLGGMNVQGEGTLRAVARRNPRGGYRLESDVRFAQLSLAEGPRAWREDSLTIRLDLLGDAAGGYRINAGGLHILTGKDGVDLDLLEPITELSSLRAARARLRVHGDLTRWHGRITNLTGLLDGMRLAGQIDLDSRLRYEGETIQLEDIKVVGRTVKLQGFGLNLEEPALDLTTSGRWLPERETLELQHTRLSCPTLTVQAPAVTLGSDATGAWQITAHTTVQGDVARLYRSVCGDGSEYSGALAGRIDLRPDEGRQVVQLDVNVQNLILGAPAAPLWRESRVNLIGHGVYDSLKDALQIVQLHLDSPSLSCDAAGQIGALHSDMELSLEGKLGYDLEKLEPQLRAYLGEGVKLTGRDVRPFHVAGSLLAPEPSGVASAPREAGTGSANATPSAALLSRLRGDAALSWQGLQALGCQIGTGELRGQLTSGLVRVAPLEASLNQGRLHLEPTLRLDPAPSELTLAKGHVIDHARLTPAACASALGYAVPVLAGAVQADGDMSLDLQGCRIPLNDLARGDVSGWLTIHSAQVSGGPLVQELSVLLKGPATLTLAKDNVVSFRLLNGRVYHSGLELHFPELTIRTSGSVGLDGSLSLTAEMPVPPKWLGSSQLAKSALGNQTIRLPIGGTLSHPKIDEQALRTASAKFIRNAAENALKQEAEGKLKKEAENGLKKLFRRK